MPNAEVTSVTAGGAILVPSPSGRSATVDGQDVKDAVTRARDAVSVARVFGEPYERGGVTVIPAARIWGGGGGGVQNGPGGEAPDGGASYGSGFGMMGRPAGVFVLRGDTVRWQPAVDPNVIVAVFLFVAIGVLGRLRRRRRRARWMAHQQALAARTAEPDRPLADTADGGDPSGG
jgi:uncharacterized spore protein YtfJ